MTSMSNGPLSSRFHAGDMAEKSSRGTHGKPPTSIRHRDVIAGCDACFGYRKRLVRLQSSRL